MAPNVIHYACGHHHFHIRAPSDVSARLAHFFVADSPGPQEPQARTASTDHAGTLDGGPQTTIEIAHGSVLNAVIRDRRYPYDRLQLHTLNGTRRFSYHRYNTHVRDIECISPRSYQVTSYLRHDENAALIPIKDAIQHELAPNEALLHAGCVSVGGQGILVVSNSGGGKTVLTTALLAAGATFVADETVLVMLNADRPLTAAFIPQAIFARFSVVARTALNTLLDSPKLWCATQLTDEQSIVEMRCRNDMSEKGGITLSPRALCRCFGAPRQAFCEIARVVILERVMYAEGLETRPMDPYEGLTIAFAHQQEQRYLRPWYRRPVDPYALENVRLESALHIRHGGDLLNHNELAAIASDSLG